jgi:hypothetical protein
MSQQLAGAEGEAVSSLVSTFLGGKAGYIDRAFKLGFELFNPIGDPLGCFDEFFSALWVDHPEALAALALPDGGQKAFKAGLGELQFRSKFSMRISSSSMSCRILSHIQCVGKELPVQWRFLKHEPKDRSSP